MMIGELIENIVVAIVIIGAILYFLNFRWFETYADFILRTAVFTFAVLIAMLRLLPTIVKGMIKMAFVLLFILVESVIYIVTAIVPFTGKLASPFHEYIDEKLHSSGIIKRTNIMRGVIVEIIAEIDDSELKFETEDDYRDELVRVKDDTIRKLERGESALALSLGLVLLIASMLDIELFSLIVYGQSFVTIIDLFLFLIAISIVYRISVLEYLTYNSDAQFESLEEFDVALSYQKAVCFKNIVKVLMPALGIAAALVNADQHLVNDVLKQYYSGDDWITYSWRRIRSQ